MITRRQIPVAALLAIALVSLAPPAIETALAQTAAAAAASPKLIERGRYLAKIAGCNDCHTPGYTQAAGKIPEKDWLTGDQLGWRGPWGTTYAINLRLFMQTLSEAQWLKLARTLETRPPMPWFAVREMSREDLRAIYHFIRHLGPAGGPAPAYVPPDKEPKPPFAQFPMPPK